MARIKKIKILNIFLSSINGKIASNRTESSAQRRIVKFTNQSDFKHLQKITSTCDAVFIGARTLESEMGAFRVAHLRKDKSEPHWYVMTKSGQINFEHAFWRQKHIPKSVLHFKNDSSFFDFFKSLSKKNIKKIALLGGGELNGFFWKHGLVSDLYLTLSPFVIESPDAPYSIYSDASFQTKLKLNSINKKNSFLFLHYKVISNEKENRENNQKNKKTS